jgi:putative spermidine/putrescine transport system ATP-binding protein
MVFQHYALFRHMTVANNIAFGLRVRPARERPSRAEIDQRVERLLELVQLDGLGGRYPAQLSGGQQQRVALARALAIEPQVLLLDEPLSALDAKVRVQLRDEIRRIQLEVGTTTLFVTHDQEEALAVADRVGVMRGGRLEQIAAPEELYSRPVNDFVADFVGVTNRLAGVADSTVATVLGHQVPLLDGSARSGAVTVLVRPEHLAVTADPRGDHTVTSVSFLGAHGRVVVALGDGGQAIVQVPSGSVGDYSPGSRVGVRPTGEPALAVSTQE